MIYKLIYTLSVVGLILNASPASADQRGVDQEVEGLRTSMQRLLYGEEGSRDEGQQVEGLTSHVGRMVLGEEETGGYELSSQGASQGLEDSEEECSEESALTHQPQSSLQTSLPQPDFSNMGQENLDPSMNSGRYVGSLVLSRAPDLRFSNAQGTVEYMSAGTPAEGEHLGLRTLLQRVRSAANSSMSRSDVSEHSPGTSAPLFRSSARVRPISEERLNRIRSRGFVLNLLASTPAEELFDESDYPDQFKFGSI